MKGIEKEVRRIKEVGRQRAVAKRINYALSKNNKAGENDILIPDITSYSNEEQCRPGFNHYNIETMWSRICPKNGKDINRWERITNKQLVDKILVGWQCQHFLQATETGANNY